VIYLDTHVVIWIYQKEELRFTSTGRSLVENEELIISPMVELEVEYLFEIKKITERSAVIIDYLRRQIGLKTSDTPFLEDVKQAAPLLTKDGNIHTHYPEAVW